MTTRNRAPRRRNVWTEVNTNLALATNTGFGVNLMPNFVGSNAGYTIVRTLLTMGFYLEGELSGDIVRATYGLVLMDADAATAGAWQDPGGVPDMSSWLMRDMRLIGAIGAVGDPRAMVHVTYDLKSARKLGQGNLSLYVVIENGPVNLAATLSIEILARVLMKAA